MPFFDRNKFVVSIELDPPVHGKHLQDGTVTGRVRMHAIEACEVRGVVLTYTILHEAGVTTGVDPAHHGAATSESLRRYHQHDKTLHTTHVLLLGSRKGTPILVAAGEYVYPFAFKIEAHHPPSVRAAVLGGSTTCCACCCATCGRLASVLAISHTLACEIIIPFSLLDKNDVFKAFEVASVFQGAGTFDVGPPSADHFEAPRMCMTCCPCLAFCSEDTPTRFRLTLADRVVALGVGFPNAPPPGIRYSIDGIIQEPYSVVVRRRATFMRNGARVHDSDGGHPALLVAEAVVFSVKCPPKLTGGMSAGFLALTESPLFQPSSSLIPTLATPYVQVTYEVEVVPDYEGPWSGLPRSDRAIVPIVICFSAPRLRSMLADQEGGQQLPLQPYVPAFAGGGGYPQGGYPPAGGGPQPYGYPGQFQMPGPQAHGPPGFDPASKPSDQWYGYVPPLGAEGAFRPAAPLAENLQAPVWGIPL